MRILLLIPSLSGGGAERQVNYLAPALACMGHDVHLGYSKEVPFKSELPGVVLHKLKARSNYDPCLLFQLLKIIRCIKPDIVHTWIVQMDILGGIAARINGIPWVLYEQSSAMAYLPTWKNSLRIRIASGASAIVSNSSGGDEYWKSRSTNIHHNIIPNGLPVDEINAIEAELPTGLSEAFVPIVLYVGRLTSDGTGTKNLLLFLEALACVRKQQNIMGVLCGEGPQRAELEDRRNKLGLTADVQFTGYLPATSVWALMKKASVFVSLSAYEGRPNTVMEAMACGCPLVVSDIPAHREILDESCALFVNPSNIQHTADVIVETLWNAATSKDRALIAKQKTYEWSIEKFAGNFESLYKEVIYHHSILVDKRSTLTNGKSDNT